MAVHFLFLRTFVSSERHVCGGRTNIQIINELVFHHPQQDSDVNHIITVCKRKAMWVQQHADKLLGKYVRERYLRQEYQTMKVPHCFNIFDKLDIELISENSNIKERLLKHYSILHRIVSVMNTLENEETNLNFYERLRSMRSSTEILLCEVYVGLSAHGSLLPPREIQETVPLCQFSERMDKFVRDYYLVAKIKDIVKILHKHYSSIL